MSRQASSPFSSLAPPKLLLADRLLAHCQRASQPNESFCSDSAGSESGQPARCSTDGHISSAFRSLPHHAISCVTDSPVALGTGRCYSLESSACLSILYTTCFDRRIHAKYVHSTVNVFVLQVAEATGYIKILDYCIREAGRMDGGACCAAIVAVLEASSIQRS